MILLDTHTLLWMDGDDAALGPATRGLIARSWQVGEVAVSAISFWECALLAQRKRILLPCAVEVWRADLIEAGVREVPVDGRIALLATALGELHRDPADRFIAATALHRTATLVTADDRLLSWKKSTLLKQDARK